MFCLPFLFNFFELFYILFDCQGKNRFVVNPEIDNAEGAGVGFFADEFSVDLVWEILWSFVFYWNDGRLMDDFCVFLDKMRTKIQLKFKNIFRMFQSISKQQRPINLSPHSKSSTQLPSILPNTSKHHSQPTEPQSR